MRDELGRFTKGPRGFDSPGMLGKHLSEKHKRKISKVQKGRKHLPQEGYQKGHLQFNSGRTHFKKGRLTWNKGTNIQSNTGRTHFKKGESPWNWMCGVPPERPSASPEYENWKSTTYKRDNYACQICGKKGHIEAHHILPWAIYPEKRYDLNNGITLCIKHHYKTRRRN